MGRLGANVSGLAYSYTEYAPIGSLRIQFPCYPPIQGALWVLSNGGNLSLWQQRRENHTTGLRPEENRPTALTGDINAPLLVLRTTSPGGGSLLYSQLLNS